MGGIFRSLYYTDVTVGSGGRITIPQNVREDLDVDDGDVLTCRIEESSDGQRQIVMWKATEAAES